MPNSVSGTKLFILVTLALFVLFFALGQYPLANGKEGQAAEIAREMLALRNYLTPYFNFIPHLETPPLFYWLTSLSFDIFGISAFSARLVPALSGLALMLFAVHFANCAKRNSLGWISAIVLMSSLGFIWISRSVVPESLFALLSAGCIGYFYLWQEQQQDRYATFSWCFLGLAVLCKGLLAPIMLLPILALSYCWSEDKQVTLREFFRFKHYRWFLLLAIPWYGLFAWQQPELFRFYLTHEQLLRLFGFSTFYGDRHLPFFVTPLYFLLLLFPWSCLILPRLVEPFRRHHYLDNFSKCLLVWLTFCLLFYSIAPVKSHYTLVSLAFPGAMLIALTIERSLQAHKSSLLRVLFYVVASSAVFVAVTFGVLTYQHDEWFTHDEYAAVIAAGCMLLFAIVGFVVNLLQRHRQEAAFYLNAGLILPILVLGVVIARQAHVVYSEKTMASVVDHYFINRPLYVYHNIEKFSSLIFYTHHPVHIIEHQHKHTRLSPATERKPVPSKFAIQRIPLQEFKHIAQTQSVLVTLNNNKQLVRFGAAVQPVTFCEVFRDGQALLLSNQLSDCELTRHQNVASLDS